MQDIFSHMIGPQPTHMQDGFACLANLALREGAGAEVAFEPAALVRAQGTEDIGGVPLAIGIVVDGHWVTPLSWSAMRIARSA